MQISVAGAWREKVQRYLLQVLQVAPWHPWYLMAWWGRAVSNGEGGRSDVSQVDLWAFKMGGSYADGSVTNMFTCVKPNPCRSS